MEVQESTCCRPVQFTITRSIVTSSGERWDFDQGILIIHNIGIVGGGGK